MTEGDNADEIAGVLVLIKGLDTSREAHYAYAIISYDKYEAFLVAQAAGEYDLSAFGTVLAHGKGRQPPIKVKREMETKYGALHDFEQRLIDALKAAGM